MENKKHTAHREQNTYMEITHTYMKKIHVYVIKTQFEYRIMAMFSSENVYKDKPLFEFF